MHSLGRDIPRAFLIWTCTAGTHLRCVVPNWNILTFRVHQVGGVGAFFSILLASSLAEFDILKYPIFYVVSRSFCLVKSMGGR